MAGKVHASRPSLSIEHGPGSTGGGSGGISIGIAYHDTDNRIEQSRTFRAFLPVTCQHCENPACVKVCPVGATWKDAETGIVRQDYDKCIGCRMCMAACPYTGARSFNWEEPQFALSHATGDADIAPHQKHTVEKCTFCYQAIAKGSRPHPPLGHVW